MNTIHRCCHALLACLAIVLAAAPLAGDAKKAPKAFDPASLKELTLFRLVSVNEGATKKVAGSSVPDHTVTIAVVDMSTGKQQSLKVTEPKDGPVGTALQGLKPGDYVITKMTHAGLQPPKLTGLTPYVLHDGEDRPGIFLLVSVSDRQFGEDICKVAKLYKLGQFAEVRVPNVHDASGKSAPDPKLAAALSEAAPGQMVEVEASPTGTPPVAKKIAAFPPADTGTFGKITEEEVPGGKTPAFEFIANSGTKIILVPGTMAGKKWEPDSKLAVHMKTFKAGALVTVRARTEGDKLWLYEITKAAPAPAAPAAPGAGAAAK